MRETTGSARLARLAGAVAIACLVAAACALGGCAAGQSDGAPASGATEMAPKTLHAGSTTYFSAQSMDPASDWDSWYLTYYGIVENLFRVSDDLMPEPWLAEECTRVDDRTWRVKLRDGVTFSNGEPLDAAAVKRAWERTGRENARMAETLPYEELSADGDTLAIRTKVELPSMENLLCDPLLCVYYVGDGVDYAADTPGTGPYRMTSFAAEKEVVLVPNERYWNGTPKLDQVALTCFTDDNAITMAMQNGEIQAVAMPSASTAAVLAQDGRFTRTSRTTSRADFIRMNMEHPVIRNDAVRTAVAFCIDRAGYAQAICQGSSVPSWGVYSETLPFGGTEGLDVKVDRCDVDAAKAALEDAGIVDSDGDGVRELDGAPVTLSLYTCTNYERFVQLADDLQSKLKEAGIQLQIVPTDYFLEDSATFAKDDPDMTLDSYAMAPTGNAAYFADIAFATGASNNFGKYSSAAVDDLVAQLDATADDGKRVELARQVAQRILDDKPYIFFANTESVVICAEGVTGLDAAPSEYYFLTAETDVA